MKSIRYHAQIWTKLALIGVMHLLVFSFFVSSARSENQTLIVDIKGSSDYQSIQKAINAANPGDTITVLPGVYTEGIVIDKAISLTGANRATTIIDGDGRGNVTTILTDDVQMSGFTLTHSAMNVSDITLLTAGCVIAGENISFSDCIIFDCQYGIYAEGTFHTFIVNCSISGVFSGILLNNCSNNTLTDVNITDSQINGITLLRCDNNILSRCIIADSSGSGLHISSSSLNVISHSIFSNNSIGVTISQSQPLIRSVNNILFSNNFMSNRIQPAYDASNNLWDNGAIGNYWDDYNGTDSNSDGIGDTAVFIPLVSKDMYPKMNPITFEETSLLALKVTSLANNAVVNGSILVEGTATAGQQKVLEVKTQIDNETEQIAKGTTHWQQVIDTSNYADGAHLIKITAVTEDGQIQSQTVSFTIKNSIDNQGEKTPGFSFALFMVCVLLYVFYRYRK